MNKHYTHLWLIAILLGFMCPTFAQKYSIQLGAFTERIAPSFFDYSGFSGVKHHLNNQQFHQYTWGNFDTPQAAEKQLELLRAKSPLHNLTNLKIIPQNIEKSTNSVSKKADFTTIQSTDFQLFSRFIAFDKDNLSLQKIDVQKLEEIREILDKNPALKLRIIATNNTPNLSPKQQATATNIIRNFLLANQIPAYRVKIIPSVNEQVAGTQKVSTTVPPVIMTLVDLKEEIVLDRFSADRLFVKELSEQKTNNVLE